MTSEERSPSHHSLPKCPQWPGMGQAEAGNRTAIQVLPKVAGITNFAILLSSLGHVQEAGIGPRSMLRPGTLKVDVGIPNGVLTTVPRVHPTSTFFSTKFTEV